MSESEIQTLSDIEAQKQRAIQMHSRQASDFAEQYEELSQDAFSSSFTYGRRQLDAWLERLLPRRGDGLRLLDVGCGTGHQLAALRARGFEVAGVDGSEAMLEHARANNPGAEFHQADVEHLPFPDDSFDFVLSIEVLRYLPASAGYLREMARVLKPGGVALVTATPPLNANVYWLVNRLSTLMPLGGLERQKQFFHSPRQLRRDFRRAGFVQPTIHGVQLGPVSWVSHLAPQLLPAFLRRWEQIDRRVANRPALREFANMLLVRAVKKAGDKGGTFAG